MEHVKIKNEDVLYVIGSRIAASLSAQQVMMQLDVERGGQGDQSTPHQLMLVLTPEMVSILISSLQTSLERLRAIQ